MADITSSDLAAALQTLKSAGATCATGTAPQRLSGCPPQQLCTLQGTELCVQVPASAASSASGAVVGAPPAILSGVGLVLIGVAVGWMLRRPLPPKEAPVDRD